MHGKKFREKGDFCWAALSRASTFKGPLRVEQGASEARGRIFGARLAAQAANGTQLWAVVHPPGWAVARALRTGPELQEEQGEGRLAQLPWELQPQAAGRERS